MAAAWWALTADSPLPLCSLVEAGSGGEHFHGDCSHGSREGEVINRGRQGRIITCELLVPSSVSARVHPALLATCWGGGRKSGKKVLMRALFAFSRHPPRSFVSSDAWWFSSLTFCVWSTCRRVCGEFLQEDFYYYLHLPLWYSRTV